jgi:translation initiation factor 2 beta subunit (eIF-2beta)/eIF-5
MAFFRRYFKEKHFMVCRVVGEIDDSDLAQHVIVLNQEAKGVVGLIVVA